MRPEIKLTYDEVEAQMALDPRQCWGYRTFVYGKIRRKHVKVTITADVKSKRLLAVDVKIEGSSEPKAAAKHIEL